MDDHSSVIGIDIGSVSISAAEINPEKAVLNTVYRFHHGKIQETLKTILDTFDLGRVCAIASTSSTPLILKVNRQYDNRIAVVAAVRHFHDEIGSILLVGGESFGLIAFDGSGNYRSFRKNTSCAAGTGSFLEQQARRLNLKGIGELSDKAFSNRGSIPKIASRCAVFAKTDLVHAQQEGYTLEQICDGLCHGLAMNIVDTLSMDRDLNTPLIFTGGVSRNRAVVQHIQSMVGTDVLVDPTGLYGAMGAAFLLADELRWADTTRFRTADDALVQRPVQKKYFHGPLKLSLSCYPEFGGAESYEYSVGDAGFSYPIEVDIYETPNPDCVCEAYLGVDIGSTSTKAVLLNAEGAVFAGFYTSTAGRPVAAVQRLFAAIDHVLRTKGLKLRILGAGTTGSGRKFAGKIMGADTVIDEITAHARAACEIDPDVDTIIEIGGQDSKFTTLKNGSVNFSVMNNVCAAGTGSFIEEQARKLGCPLTEYASRAEGQRSPIVSDRCTVFMERDMNYYFSEGYAVNEVLASVLHAIRENYLTKVAVEGSIGNKICFQGATAKNRALVAAFEQRLQKPIQVSRYCHLTGAMGVALTLRDQGVRKSKFRGIGLYRETISVQSEVCELCTNHCKITVAQVGGEKVAYGFLCGREYDQKGYVNNNTSGFALLKERKKVFSFKSPPDYSEQITIGIPAALHLFEDFPLWEKFFQLLGIKTVTSDRYSEAVKEGKHMAGAEFCSPMAALHGHVQYLKDRVDYVFLPVYLEKKNEGKGIRRQYCYYTQFSSGLISGANSKMSGIRFLTPLVHYLYSSFRTKVELYTMLRSIMKAHIGYMDVSKAYDAAYEYKASCLLKLKDIYRRASKNDGQMHVVFLGRPYTVLSEFMNKGIPDIFAALGIRVFFQDMLSYSREDVAPIDTLLREVHWLYASHILEAAQVVAQSENAYPVMITSFKCSPDSFIVDYFKKIMEAHEKPYLILQLDEHASSVGYETRIEAAIRSFENHHASRAKKRPVEYPLSFFPTKEKCLTDKTLIIPNWDNITMKFVVANLKREGIDARLMEETETGIKQSMRHNSGQCLPVTLIAHEFIDYVRSHDLDPSRTLLWMIESKIACNIGLYPHYLKSLIDSFGEGMEKAGVYTGPMSFIDISLRMPVNTYFAYMFGGLVRKMGCRIRPYEIEKGATDRVISRSIDVLTRAFLGNGSKEEALEAVVSSFESIERSGEQKPKVAIFGDLYVRDNAVMNQDLIHFIEKHNGEVIVTPYSAYVQMIADAYLKKWFTEGRYLDVLSSKALIATVNQLEKAYHKYFGRILDKPAPGYDESPEKILSDYNIGIEHTGESMDNLLKIHYIKKHYPDVSLFVQTSPAFCCPSLITEAMANKIEEKTGVPIVSITYDGTSSNKNEAIIPYLASLSRS